MTAHIRMDASFRARARVHWKNQRLAFFWFLVYVGATVACFGYKANCYATHEEAQAVFGGCVAVARGSAQCINLNAYLVLLSVCRHFITMMRAAGPVRHMFPFDSIERFHLLCGIMFGFFTLLHVLAHVCDIHRFSIADEQDLYNLVGDKLGEIPEGQGDRWLLLLQQPMAITGIIMTVCVVVGYALIFCKRSGYNTFWWTHHLFLIMLILMCFHGMQSLLEPYQSIFWIMVPFTLYMVPRLWREFKRVTCKVIDISIKRGNVIGVRLTRPQRWNKLIESGMYANLNIPLVSRLEWHPFTLTSTPEDNFIEFHFARVGDWTRSAYDLFAQTRDADDMKGSLKQSLVVKVEGPISAPAQGFADYEILVLIGGGIGITPMISVLKQLMKHPGKMKRTFFFWTVREAEALEWFGPLMDEICDNGMSNIFQIRPFLTSAKSNDDIESALFSVWAFDDANKSLLSGKCAHHGIQAGRPNWEEELSQVRKTAKELEQNHCGVFLCGPKPMAKEVNNVCFNLSVEDADCHFYFAKETF